MLTYSLTGLLQLLANLRLAVRNRDCICLHLILKKKTGCSALNNVSIPSSVKIIGRNAFFGCRVRTLIIPTNVLFIDKVE